jgi:pimeloyl-ACP methyl ester carboxylesterase
LSFITAGKASKPALLLLHGFPTSSRCFREVVPELCEAACVIAPESDVVPEASFSAFGRAISELLERLAIGPCYICLHDWGAPVGFHIAIEAPGRVLGLIVQNANAHRTGSGAAAHQVAQFDAIAEFLPRRQPLSLMLWERHDAFFDLSETLSWMQALPRMETHILDAGPLLFETHAAQASSLILDFIKRTERESVSP